jgi:arylsulfatase A-like enzyme
MPKTLVALVLLVALTVPSLTQSPRVAGLAQGRPNFVVIVADDLDVASIAEMTKVNRLLVGQGVTFQRFFATTPLCCPARASILRGQYAHNHGVLRNTGDNAGFDSFHGSGVENDTLATLMSGAGYETALVGKYLNGYASKGDGQTFIPPGWDYWAAGIDHDAYGSFNYTLNVNGHLEKYGRTPRDHMTNVLSDHALEFLEQSATGANPFFLYLAPYAPHAPAQPAPRDEGKYRGVRAPRSPAFNERNVRDKPHWVQQSARLSDDRIQRIDDNYQRRLESLLGLDDLVGRVMAFLEERELLGSTYILFLSDNGYFMGEHRQPHGKDAPYDPASRIPLVIRGPEAIAGLTVDDIALNIDLLPTIADLAGLSPPSYVDGRTLRPLLRGEVVTWRQVALIEGFGKEKESIEESEVPTPPFRALRGHHLLYVEYETGERELYDLRRDRFQLSNLAAASKSLLRPYSRRLDELTGCSRLDCARIENEPLPELPKKVKRAVQKKKQKARAHKREQAKQGKTRRGEPGKARHGRPNRDRR